MLAFVSAEVFDDCFSCGCSLSASRAGNEPSYSGSARARLEKSSARAQLMS